MIAVCISMSRYFRIEHWLIEVSRHSPNTTFRMPYFSDFFVSEKVNWRFIDRQYINTTNKKSEKKTRAFVLTDETWRPTLNILWKPRVFFMVLFSPFVCLAVGSHLPLPLLPPCPTYMLRK